MEKFKLWWGNLAQREQQMLVAAAAVVLLGILYWGIWAPISQAQENARRNLAAEQQTLDYVKQTASRIMALRQTGGKRSAVGSLSALVNRSADKFGLEITRMQPQGDKIQLWLDDVPFTSLMDYLSDLVQQGLSLDNLDITATDTPGYVQVRRIQVSR
ncbi:type II secretion system protein M [Shewanella sp. NFH-SH190041]|uniref:type II secretion system protein M n=1 Tax=Shewanella sp. NFH-SH190041 TaxID=2950245 RepID=UPI0021C383E2|nr:type II secretion system protein M [Shewanella sp. NFH-SH190041]BDM62650.1 type II secretion system protein M [Shewanella sp. NFH-SH190041]